MKNKESVFESENISSSIWRLALPTIVSQLITTVYNLADTFWVGRVNDPNQLAAMAIIFPASMLITAFGNLFGIGAGTCIASRLGAKDEKRAKQVSAFAIFAGLLLAIIYSLVITFFRSPILNLLGATPDIELYTNQYLNWVIAGGAVPSILNIIFANMLRGEGCSLQASIGLSGGGILNMIIDPFFVLPFGLNMQIEGAAIATLISNVLTTIYFIITIYRRREKSQIRFNLHFIKNTKAMGVQVVLTGVPSALQTFLSAISNLALNTLMIGYSESAEAAVGIIKKIDAIPMSCMMGLAQGAAPLIAYNYGAKRFDKMKHVLKLDLIYSVAGSIVILIIIETLAHPLNSLFISDPQTITYGAGFLRLHCASIPFMAITYVLVAFFQSVNSKTRAFILSLIRKGIVDIPMMFLMNVLIPMYGIIACQPITDVISASAGIVLFILWKKSFSKKGNNNIDTSI